MHESFRNQQINLLSGHFSYRQEVARKLIHLSSLWMPAAIYYLDQKTALSLLAIAFAGVLLFEVVRKQLSQMGHYTNRLFGFVLRDKEKLSGFHLTSATYMLAAALIVTYFFPKLIAITALVIMLVADSAAALFGRRYGKTSVLGKSLEGSTAFLITALLCVIGLMFTFGLHSRFALGGLFAAVASTAVELCSALLPFDDNLTITLAAALSMWLVM